MSDKEKLEEKKEEPPEFEYVVVLMRRKDGKGIHISPKIEGSGLAIDREATNSDVTTAVLEAAEIIRSKACAIQVVGTMADLSRGMMTTKSGIEVPAGGNIPPELRRR